MSHVTSAARGDAFSLVALGFAGGASAVALEAVEGLVGAGGGGVAVALARGGRLGGTDAASGAAPAQPATSVRQANDRMCDKANIVPQRAGFQRLGNFPEWTALDPRDRIQLRLEHMVRRSKKARVN